MSENPTDRHIFTNSWFVDSAKGTWDHLMPQIRPAKILEIGSYEGASACYVMDTLAKNHPIEIHCIDSWEGGIEHQQGGASATDMSAVEKRFLHNTNLSISMANHTVELIRHKGASDLMLAKLLARGMSNYFDFIYIDGSHQAPDVLCDAVLSFKLLKIGGVMAFDDYLWSEPLPYGTDPIRCPKLAIDAFTNIYCRKLRILPTLILQLYLQKTGY